MGFINSLLVNTVASFDSGRKMILKVTEPYIGGHSLVDGVDNMAALNARGVFSSGDILGESAESVEDAQQSLQQYLDFLSRYPKEGITYEIMSWFMVDYYDKLSVEPLYQKAMKCYLS